MYCIRDIIPLLLVFHSFLFLNVDAQVVRILPIGNSITYDETTYDVEPNIRPAGVRISYRYRLCQLLTEAGYSFDFVGSENSGNDFFQNPGLDDNAGFPGINAAQMAYMIQTGYNQRYKQYEAPGPYLIYYPADIILLHIGTCDVEVSPDHVEDILDNIRLYLPNAIILVARIIQRVPYCGITNAFNNNVQAMVAARGDNRIISVNMETGAGIDYSFSTDMTDYVHPNQNGYRKMASKWFEAIGNLNSAPHITEIPQQYTNEGSAFNNLALDNFISDAEDPDNLISWTFKQQPSSNLLVTIDGSRILHVSIINGNLNGSENLRLIAEDSGNGAFRKKDSIDVTYTIKPGNNSPLITSTPILLINEDAPYNYTVVANDSDAYDVLAYSVPLKPEWLVFDPGTHVLSGIPTNNGVGISDITIQVTDGTTLTNQTFQLTVINKNDPPVIISQPVLSVSANEPYLYKIIASDIDVVDELTYSAISKPEWLTFTANLNGGTLNGTPLDANIGNYGIILQVNDGEASVLQGFTLIVTNPTGISSADNSISLKVYPNPVSDVLYFKTASVGKTSIELYDVIGNLYKRVEAGYGDMFEINIADLSNGIYFYIIHQGDKAGVGKIIKNDSH